jgi:hypothetical protein
MITNRPTRRLPGPALLPVYLIGLALIAYPVVRMVHVVVAHLGPLMAAGGGS